MPLVEEAFKTLISEGKYAVGGWVLGPFTLGGQIIELDLLLKGIKKEADKVHGFMEKMTRSRHRCGQTLPGPGRGLYDHPRNGFRN